MSTPASSGPVVVGLDIGGTKTSAAVVDESGAVLARFSAPTPGQEGRESLLRNASRVVAEVVRAGGIRPLALGVGSAGVIDSTTGTVVSATDVLRGWAGTPVAAALQEATGLRTTVDNAVHAHAVGEAWVGAAKGVDSVLYVAVGTGVGATWLHDGEVWHGARHVAGHLGHIPSPEASGLRCVCGGEGHLEAIAAGPAICRALARRTGRQTSSLQDVVEAAANGDAPAAYVLTQGARALGAAVGGTVNLLDPHMVVIGGGVAGAGEGWWQPMRAALRAELLPATHDVVVHPSALGADAALIGAARLGWEALRG